MVIVMMMMIYNQQSIVIGRLIASERPLDLMAWKAIF